MDLSDRKRKILQGIVNEYISTGEPVGSRTMAKYHDLGLSSATIRNEMADLEDMGFLDQPHTSAGRIPSDAAYRLYVDRLMEKYLLTMGEINSLVSRLDLRVNELEKLIARASDVMSEFTNYTAFAVTPAPELSRYKSIRLMLIESSVMLMVLVTVEGIVRNNTARVSSDIDEDFLNVLGNFLDIKLAGKTFSEIDFSQFDAPFEHKELLYIIEGFIKESLKVVSGGKLFIGGTSKIFLHPEYRDFDRAQKFMNMLDNEDEFINIVNSVSEEKPVVISIGEENEPAAMKDCSLVISHYGTYGKLKGKIGIIGPTRMDYAKTITSLECMTGKLSEIVEKLFE